MKIMFFEPTLTQAGSWFKKFAKSFTQNMCYWNV